ncbi:MAG: ATP-binding protein [Candidatus Kapabacteria bacterium]|nr:ATP-binding protein [Candidatus Kapabacteria bacterium]
MIKRSISVAFSNYIQTFPVVALIGARQVGKTTFAKEYAKQQGDKALYLDLERTSDRNKLRDPELYLQSRSDKTIILDEIQTMPDIFPLLRSLVDDNRKPGRFILLGSASPALLQSSSETLAGRIATIKMEPIHYRELTKGILMENHWLRGGFPESLLSNTDSTSYNWREQFIKTYIERDLPALGSALDPLRLQQLLNILADIHGGILNYSSIAQSMSVSVPTIQRYIDFLEHAFIIRRLQPYHINATKRIVKAPRIYITDSGMLHSLLEIETHDNLAASSKLGTSWEGYALQQIIANISERITPYYYRTQDGAEIDLLLQRGTKTVAAIEIKYSSTPTLTKGSVLAFADSKAPLKIIITPKAHGYTINNNVQVHSIKTMWDVLEANKLIK